MTPSIQRRPCDSMITMRSRGPSESPPATVIDRAPLVRCDCRRLSSQSEIGISAMTAAKAVSAGQMEGEDVT